MAFAQKTWKDRVAEYINRRILTKEDGTTELVTVERSEGTISQEGDAFSAANMNDLEQRIANEFSEQNKKLSNIHLTWGLKKACQGNEAFTAIEDNYQEYKLMAFDAISKWWCATTIPRAFLTDETQYIQAGANGGLVANFYVSKNSIRLSSVSYSGTDSTNYSMYVYVR